MAGSGGKVVLLVSLATLAGGALVAGEPATATARASACHRFGATKAKKLSNVQARRSIGCLVNRTRKRHGLGRAHGDHRLRRAAQKHTSYMKRHHCFSHECPGERSFLSRLRKVNYVVHGLSRWKIAENIAWGGGGGDTPKAIVHGWMHSPGHRANILDPDYRQLGIGFAAGCRLGKRAGVMFTTDFGMRRR
jgi:uncharacterized protein YkwD